MWNNVRRLLLGIGLIVVAAAVLLLSDTSRERDRPRRVAAKVPKVAILQQGSQAVLDEGVAGMILGLGEGGYEDGRTVAISKFNAENDNATAAAIAGEITSGDYDLILSASTLSLQAVANANQTRRKRHVFALVTDPAAAGVGIAAGDPLDHPPWMAGYGTLQPVRRAIELARRAYPGLRTVGIPWNPAEANSEVSTRLAKEACAELGIDVLEASVENSAAAAEAAASLVARGVDLLWSPADVTILTALDSVVAAARRGRIPMITNIPGSADQGTLFDVGADYTEVGRLAGELAARILGGLDPAIVPIENKVPERVTVNPKALEGLKDPWQIPDDVMQIAEVVGRPKPEAGGAAAPAPDRHALAVPTAAPRSRQWRIDLLQYVEVQDAEDAKRGIKDGLARAGLEVGRDVRFTERNAQGDMPTLSALVDAAITEGTDLLMTLSTPTLQAALARGKNKPIVFTFCASGVAAGAGKSDTDHLPNVTGVPSASPYAELVDLVREAIPGAKRIGTLVVPSEANSVFNVAKLVEIAKGFGIETEQIAVNSITEVPDAATSLMTRRLDAVVQVASNLTTSSFVSLSRAANAARVPLFGGLSGDLTNGAAIVVARDYHDAGLMAASLAVRVMNGEDTAGIPFQPLATSRILVNLDAARAQELEIPPAILARADEVIGR